MKLDTHTAAFPPADCFTARQALLCGALAALLDLAVGMHRLSALASGALVNPDSYMRLVRLDDIVAAQSPIDVVARDGSGAGTIIHWSHLLDSILLLLAAPIAPLLGQHDALRWAGIALGPLGAGLLGVALAWLTAPLSDSAWRWTAPVIAMLALPVVGYSIPGVVHHHALLALSGVMCAGWAARIGEVGTAAGWRIGVWAAFGLWLSPESLMITLLALGGMGFGWLLRPDDRRWSLAIAHATTTLAVLSALALAVDPSSAGPLSVQVDRLSIVFVTLAAFGAGTGWALRAIDRLRLSPGRRAAAALIVAGTAAAAWIALFPSVLTTPAGVINEQYDNAFDGISEMLAVTTVADAMLYLLHGGMAAIVAITLAIRRRSPELAYVAACVVLLLAAAAMHRRFSTYPACAGAAAVPVAITLLSRALANRPPIVPASLRLTLLLFLLLAPGIPAALAEKPPEPEPCSVSRAAPALRQVHGQVVLADVNDTPELLYRTRVHTVGSLYRNVTGFLRLRAAWRAQALDAVPPTMRATGASLVLFCSRAARSGLVADLPADTLWDRLRRGEVPEWLHELPLGPESGFRLFRLGDHP